MIVLCLWVRWSDYKPSVIYVSMRSPSGGIKWPGGADGLGMKRRGSGVRELDVGWEGKSGAGRGGGCFDRLQLKLVPRQARPDCRPNPPPPQETEQTGTHRKKISPKHAADCADRSTGMPPDANINIEVHPPLSRHPSSVCMCDSHIFMST